ncbi:MAG: hypothetical protein RTU30_13230 [Candidatus Thorarchaeota archaeon]
MNTTIIYDNGAHITGNPQLICGGSGVIRIAITEDINLESGSFLIDTTGPNTLYLFVDLPEGVNGLYQGPPVLSYEGWLYDGFYTYSTNVYNEWPLIDIRPGSETVYAVLKN